MEYIRTPIRPGRTRLLQCAAATGAAALVLGTGLAGTAAAAQQAHLTVKYSCQVGPLAHHTLTARISARLPTHAVAGRPIPRLPEQVSTTASAGEARLIRLLGVRSVRGSVDARTSMSTRREARGYTVRLTAPRTRVPYSGGFTVTGAGLGPAPVFDHPGKVQVVAGNIVLHAVGTTAGGRARKASFRCSLASGQRTLIGSFRVAKARHTAPVQHGAHSAPAPPRTAPAPTSHPRTPTPGAAHRPRTPTPHGALAATGDYTDALSLLAGGAIIAAGALIFHTARRKTSGY